MFIYLQCGRVKAKQFCAVILIVVAIFPYIAAATDDGDDFSNNLFSDLGPILALFGEQVAMQFMSQSMGWADNIIFAMAPLGVITAIVGAIRVGGPIWLKAIIGRARENRAAAEVELMSSTSSDVCELWNGQTIVRMMGSPEIVELLYFPTLRFGRQCGLFTLEDAVAKGLLTRAKSKPTQRVHRLLLTIDYRICGIYRLPSVQNEVTHQQSLVLYDCT